MSAGRLSAEDVRRLGSTPVPAPLIQKLDGAEGASKVEFVAVFDCRDGARRAIQLQRWPIAGRRHRASLHMSDGGVDAFVTVDVGLGWSCAKSCAALIDSIAPVSVRAAAGTEGFIEALNVEATKDRKALDLLSLLGEYIRLGRAKRYAAASGEIEGLPNAL